MRKLTIIFILLSFIVGCGQSGPLYHSDNAPQPVNQDIEKQQIKQEANP